MLSSSSSVIIILQPINPWLCQSCSGKSEGGSTGLLAGMGALVVAAGFALTSLVGTKSAAPKPNKIKAKIKVSAMWSLHEMQVQLGYSI